MAIIQRIRQVDWGASGASLYYRAVNAAGQALIARTNAGISEYPVGSGDYKILVNWDTSWFGQEIWDDGDAQGDNATDIVVDAFDALTGTVATVEGVPTAAQMVERLKLALLKAPAGVVTVVVDGQTVTYSRAQAVDELKFWQQQAAKESGGRPRVASINLSGA